MVEGFSRHVDGTTERLASIDDLATAWAKDGSIVWVDFEEPTEADLRAFDQIIKVDSGSLEDCLHGDQRPRVDEFEDHVFMVLYGLVGPDSDEADPRKLALFCGGRFLTTVHDEPLRTVRAVLDRCARNTAPMLSGGVDLVLYQIIDGMVDKYLLVAERFESRIEDLEDASLDPEVDEGILADAATLRRQLLEVRGLAVAQRELVTPIAKGEFDYISESLEQRFGHVRDHLTQVIDLVDALREQLTVIRENYHTALANRTNAIMKTLTVMATIMLPLSLVAGIYGMNLPLWPPPEHPFSFWAVVGAMLATAIGLLTYFRLKRWL